MVQRPTKYILARVPPTLDYVVSGSEGEATQASCYGMYFTVSSILCRCQHTEFFSILAKRGTPQGVLCLFGN